MKEIRRVSCGGLFAKGCTFDKGEKGIRGKLQELNVQLLISKNLEGRGKEGEWTKEEKNGRPRFDCKERSCHRLRK